MSAVARLLVDIPRFTWGYLFDGTARPPAIVWVPALLVAALLLVSPVYLALRTVGAGEDAFDLIFRTRTLWVVARTVALMVAVMLGCIVIAAPLAWLTVRTDLPWRGFWRVATMLPLALPSYIVGFAIAVGLGPRGILQGWLEAGFGVERIPSIYGFTGAAFTLIIISFPYVLLPVRAALWSMDVSLEESARVLGRDRWQTFRSITLPMLRPAILAGGLLTALYALSDFGAVAIMRYETFTWSIFIQYGAALNRTLAAAWSLALIVLALAVVWGENTARNAMGGRYYRSRGGAARLPEPVPLGRWRWPALTYCSAVLAVSIGLPVVVLIYWTVRGVVAAVAGGGKLRGCLRVGRGSHGFVRRAYRRAGGALSGPLQPVAGAPGFRGFRPARHRHRPGPGVFRGKLRSLALSIAGDTGGGLRDAVPAGGGGFPADLVAPGAA